MYICVASTLPLLLQTQPPPPLRVTLKFIYVWAECPGYFYCQDDLEELENEVEQMWAGHLGSVLPSPRKYSGIVVLALLFLCLSTAKYWIMSFHTICPQASLKIHEWAILWGTGAIVCPSRPSTKDLTRNTWRGASVVISQTDLAEAPVSASKHSNSGFWGNSASLQHVSSIQMTWWSLYQASTQSVSLSRRRWYLINRTNLQYYYE